MKSPAVDGGRRLESDENWKPNNLGGFGSEVQQPKAPEDKGCQQIS